MHFEQRAIDARQKIERFRGDGHIDDAAIARTALPLDEPGRLQPIDQPRDAGYDGDHAVGDFQDRQRAAFAAQDAQDVVLLGRQAKRAKQPGKPNLQLIGRAKQIEHRLLLRQIEGGPLFDFLLKGHRNDCLHRLSDC
jgi:hypothetical protein